MVAVNSVGASEPSPESYYMLTLRQKPDSRLSIVSARNVSSTSVRLEWLQPAAKEIHGEFLGYRIRYVHQFNEHAYYNSTSQTQSSTSTSNNNQQQQTNNGQQQEQPTLDSPFAKEVTVRDPSQTFYVVKGLNTYTAYKFSVQVFNPAGDGPQAEVLVMTDEGGK